ncbi:uncharacterized protein LOC134823226 [Bolinopsis microptera]|uniref:uncharacterized protein LOC134823226 n=1 Tax=Bolinopsis microptera TaxID=2820187 RepID=UPI0030790C92
MSGPENSYSVWRTTSDHQLDLSNSTTSNVSHISQSLDSLISDQSQSSIALNNSMSGFDIASLIQSAGLMGGQHRSISAPAAYRVQRTLSTGQNLPTIHQQQRLPTELFCGLTPPPSPTYFKKQEYEHLIPSPKRLNSQPSPTYFETFKGMPSITLPTAPVISCSTSSSFVKQEVKETETKDMPPERTTSGKRKRIEDDYVMIEPIKKENSAQQEMRDVFEDIVQTRAMLNQLKSTPSLTRRKEKSRLNSALDRKIKRFKEMRLTYLESCLTMEHNLLRNVLDKTFF